MKIPTTFFFLLGTACNLDCNGNVVNLYVSPLHNHGKPHFRCGGMKIDQFYSLETKHVVMRYIIDNWFDMKIFYITLVKLLSNVSHEKFIYVF